MKDVRKVKALQSIISNKRADAEILQLDIIAKQKEYSQKIAAIKLLERELKSLDKDGKVKISEHAILRYIERVKGIDISAIEGEILNEKILTMIETLGGTGTYPGEGFSLIMKDYTITTVLTNN